MLLAMSMCLTVSQLLENYTTRQLKIVHCVLPRALWSAPE